MSRDSAYKQLFDSLSTAVIVVDGNLHLQHLNPAAEVLLAVSAARVCGEPITSFFHESDSAVTALLEANKQSLSYTKRRAHWQLVNGEKLTVDYTVTPINESGTLLIEVQPLDRLLRISRDESIIAAQETTRNLVRGMAHEIKNPLGGIRGAAQLLARELHKPELAEYTSIIIEEADRLRNLVDKMLGPNKLLERKETNIHEVLERIYSLINVEAQERIKLVRDYDPSIPEFLADKEQLIQVVLNITRNAMQALLEQASQNGSATDQPPQITLQTRSIRQFTIGHTRHRLALHVSIIDNGPGIPESIRESLFYPMVSGRAEGTGLGLSIAQSIVNQHQGIIECDSKAGRTQFSIYLPLDLDISDYQGVST